MMAEDRSDQRYTPEITPYCRQLVEWALESTLIPCWSWAHSYSVVFDSTDDLINDFKPGNSAKIYLNTSRLAFVRRVLNFTHCVMRPEGDEKLHILVPTTTGSSYDYEYDLTDAGHKFLRKSEKKNIIIPNVIIVKDDFDNPAYAGSATDTESANAYHEVAQFIEAGGVADNDECDDIADAVLKRMQMGAESAAAIVPMNVGAECYDYVKITDSREGTSVTGNIGYIRRTFEGGKYEMEVGFGGWLSIRQTVNDLEIFGEYGGAGDYYNQDRLTVENAYITNLQADQIDMTSVTLDTIGEGEIYHRVQAVHFTPGGLLMVDNAMVYAAGYNPTDKFDFAFNDLDDIPEGMTYGRILQTQLSAGKIYLSDICVFASGYDPSDKESAIHKGTSAPSDPAVGDLWIDTNYTPNRWKRWNGSSWVKASPDSITDIDWDMYSMVLSTDITAGHVELKHCWGNLDNIGDGWTWARLYTTDISSGHIKLTSDACYDGKWYNEGGISIDVDDGIEIAATGTAAIKIYGSDQCMFYDSDNVLRGSISGATDNCLCIECEEALHILTLSLIHI